MSPLSKKVNDGMKVSGFTFIRNAVQYDFPIVEAITSVLPIVDEFIVNVGKCDDGTLALVQSIETPKMKIIETEWNDALREDGQIFGIQQDMALSHCTGDWAILVQGDEVLHEDDYPEIQNAMTRYLHHRNVLGLVLKMMHFKGDYWSLDPWMYRKATRIIRNHRGVRSAPDGCDFRTDDKGQMIKSGPYGRRINAKVFHYGWVKEPRALEQKLSYQMSRHEGNQLSARDIALRAAFHSEYPTYDILKDYGGTHPNVMKTRVDSKTSLYRRRNRWFNPRFYKEVWSHGFKG